MSFALADLAAVITGAGLIKNLLSPNQNQPPPLAGQGGLGGQGTTSGWPTPQPSQNPPPQVPGTRDQPLPATTPGTGDQVASTGPVVPVPPRTPNAVTPAVGNVPVPRGGTPSWMTLPPAQLYATNFGPVESVIMGPESGGKNIRQIVNGQPTGPASGYLQIEDDTWRNYAPQAGVDLNRWPTAMSAPPMVQQAVAQNMPVSRWAKGTYAAVKAAFPWITPDMTLGQIDQIATRAGPQRYIPAQPTRGPGEWGRTPSGGYALGPGNMPTSQSDFGNIMQKAMLMAPLLSLFTRAPSTAMLASYGSFVKGYQQGQLLQQQLSKGQWQENLKETTARLETEAIEAGDAFTALQNDPGALSSVLEGIANKYGDDPMRAALANGGPDAVHKLLQGRDAYFTDLNKAQIAQEKLLRDEQRFQLQQETTNLENQIRLKQLEIDTAKSPDVAAKAKADIDKLRRQQEDLEQRRKRLQEFGVPGQALPTAPADEGGGGGDSGGGDQAPAPSETPQDGRQGAAEPATGPQGSARTPTPPDGSETGSASPAPDVAPYQVASTAPTGPPSQAQQDATAIERGMTGAKGGGGGTQVAAAGPTPETGVGSLSGYLLRGGDVGNLHGMDAAAIGYAQQEAFKKRAQLDDLLNNPDLTGKGYLDAVRKVDPQTAQQIQNLLDYKTGVGGGGFGNRTSEWNQFLSQQALKANPSWNPQQYVSRQEFRTSFNPDKMVGRTLQRTQRLLNTAEALAEDAKHLPPGPVPINQLQAWFESGIVGDPKWTKFVTDWRLFATEAQGVANMGNPTVTLTSHMIDTLRIGATPQMVRQGMAQDLQAALSSIDPNLAGWHRTFQGEANPEMFSQEVYSRLTQFANMDINSGDLPPALPPVGTAQKSDDGKTHYYLGGYPRDPANWSTKPPPEAP